MTLKNYLIITACLLTCAIYSIDTIKDPKTSAEERALLLTNPAPFMALVHKDIPADQRTEIFDSLTKIIDPKVVRFIQENPHNKTAQVIKRSLNLIASRMTLLVCDTTLSAIVNQHKAYDKVFFHLDDVTKMGASPRDETEIRFAASTEQSHATLNLMLLDGNATQDTLTLAFDGCSKLIGLLPLEFSYMTEGIIMDPKESNQTIQDKGSATILTERTHFFKDLQVALKGILK